MCRRPISSPGTRNTCPTPKPGKLFRKHWSHRQKQCCASGIIAYNRYGVVPSAERPPLWHADPTAFPPHLSAASIPTVSLTRLALARSPPTTAPFPLPARPASPSPRRKLLWSLHLQLHPFFGLCNSPGGSKSPFFLPSPSLRENTPYGRTPSSLYSLNPFFTPLHLLRPLSLVDHPQVTASVC